MCEAMTYCSCCGGAEVQVLAKDARHHGHKSKHDGDDHHNLQCRVHFILIMGKLHVLDIPST